MAALGPDQVRRVAIVGAGVIGGGWAVHYLRVGLDVAVYDPAPDAEAALLRLRDAAWPVLERLGLRQGASPDRLTFHTDLAGAIAGADFVQENGPEDAKGKMSKAIYKLDGEKLTICVSAPGKDRPKELMQVEDEAYLFTLKKQK